MIAQESNQYNFLLVSGPSKQICKGSVSQPVIVLEMKYPSCVAQFDSESVNMH